MTPKLSRLALRLAAALCLQLAAAGAVRAAPLDDLRRQVEASQFEQAYATAQANPQLIGDVHFDFLYGVAAINVGRVAEGLLALERHLAAVPANDRARLELARGYFLLGEFTRARAEFEFVLRYNPPAGVRANITGYLQAMQVRELADNRATARLYAEGGLGYDNNVNGGTFHDSFQLNFAPQPVEPTGHQLGDGFFQVALGGQQLMRVSNRMSVFAGADLDHRQNFKERDFDLTNGGVYAGFSQLAGNTLWRLTLAASELQLGGSRYRDSTSALGEALFTLSNELGATAFVQYSEQRYSATEEAHDAGLTTVGGTVTRNFSTAPYAPSVGLRVSWTQEHNTRLRRDLNRDTPLVRVYGSFSPVERMRIALGLTAFRQDFGAEDVAFASVRHDTALSLDLVANYALDTRWSVRAEALYAVNRSNQDLYDTHRKSAALKLRYQY